MNDVVDLTPTEQIPGAVLLYRGRMGTEWSEPAEYQVWFCPLHDRKILFYQEWVGVGSLSTWLTESDLERMLAMVRNMP